MDSSVIMVWSVFEETQGPRSDWLALRIRVSPGFCPSKAPPSSVQPLCEGVIIVMMQLLELSPGAAITEVPTVALAKRMPSANDWPESWPVGLL